MIKVQEAMERHERATLGKVISSEKVKEIASRMMGNVMKTSEG